MNEENKDTKERWMTPREIWEELGLPNTKKVILITFLLFGIFNMFSLLNDIKDELWNISYELEEIESHLEHIIIYK